jgi:CRP-like cAMP-binding protein
MNSPRETNHFGSISHVDDALTILRRLPVFKNISLEMVKLYAYLSHREEYGKGDIILHQGRPCDGVRLIVRGEVYITHTTLDRTILLQKLSADSLNYFGELALISKFNWFFSAYAHSDTVILSISRESFGKVIERYPETFIGTVGEIVKLRIKRFSDQTNQLISQLEDDALDKISINPVSGNTNDG